MKTKRLTKRGHDRQTPILQFILHRCSIPLLLILCFVLPTTGCKEQTPEVSVPSVVVIPSEKMNVPVIGHYIGVTQASLDVEVRSRVNGFVEEQLFVEGSAVKEGELLYRIDNRPYQARVDRLQAKLEIDQAILAKAQRDVKRLEPLYQQDAVSQLDFDNALSAEEQAKASVAASKAELKEAVLELGYTEITAPISGIVGESLVDIGNLAGSGSQSLLTTVKQINPIYVKFNMSALDYLNSRRRIKTFWERINAEERGKALQGYIRINLPDDSEYRYTGDIQFTAPSVNPQTGTFVVRAVLPNPDRELLPGQHTRVRIQLDELPDTIVIPEETIQIEQGGAYVMVVLPNDIVEQRFIVTGPHLEGKVVVNSGLDANERIIIEGMHRVRHGQTVSALSREEYEQLKAHERENQLQTVGQPGDDS